MEGRIEAEDSDAELAGKNGGSWVRGYNGIYKDGPEDKSYRVAVRLASGAWVSYGHFKHLYAATYVANVAICAQEDARAYVMNSFITNEPETFDAARREIREWLSEPPNKSRALKARAHPRWSEAIQNTLLECATVRVEADRIERRLTAQIESLKAELSILRDEKPKMLARISALESSYEELQALWESVSSEEKRRIDNAKKAEKNEELVRRAKEGTAPRESLELALENASRLGLTPEQISVLEDAHREKIRVLSEQPVGCPTCLQVPCICAGRDSYWSATDR